MLRQLTSLSAPRRALLHTLLLAALALRLLVPAGYMPQGGGALSLSVTICSGLGEDRANITIDRDAPAGQDRHDPCPFAVGAMPADLPAPVILPVLAVSPETAVPLLHTVAAPGRGLAAPPPPATGPPLIF